MEDCLRPVSLHVSKLAAIALSMGHVRKVDVIQVVEAFRVASVVVCGIRSKV